MIFSPRPFSLRRGQYLRPVNNRFADCYLVAIGNKQHPVQFDSAALSHVQTLDIDGLALGYFILLAASFNNSVNFKPPKINYTSYYGSVSNGGLAGYCSVVVGGGYLGNGIRFH